MRQLRHASQRPLLRQVKGKPHATNEDHETHVDPKPAQEQDEDLSRDPQSSDDDNDDKHSVEMKPLAIPKVAKPESVKRKISEIEAEDYGPLFGMYAGLEARKGHLRNKMTYGKAPKRKGDIAAVATTTVRLTQVTKAKKKEQLPVFKKPPDVSPTTKPMPRIEFRQPPNISRITKAMPKIEFRTPPELSPITKPMSKIEFQMPPSIDKFTPSSPKPTLQPIPAHRDVSARSPLGLKVPSSSSLLHQTKIAKENPSRCPTCGETVAAEVLSAWEQQYPEMTIRMQQKFCREHGIQTAREKWNRDHPKHTTVIDIDWKLIDQRLDNIRSKILWLIERPDSSYFRSQFEKRVVDTGGSRSMLKHVIGGGSKIKQDETKTRSKTKMEAKKKLDSEGAFVVSTGYYGTKGLKKIMNFIAEEFSPALRARIGSDRIIAARDVSGYIHMVLAPEVASRLIMEDMTVNIEQARRIMAASTDLGDMLYATIEDDA